MSSEDGQSHEEYLKKFTPWFMKHWSYSIHHLGKRFSIGYHDAEDVVSDCRARCAKPEAAQIKVFSKATLIGILRNGAMAFFEHRDAFCRGCEKKACSLHDLKEWELKSDKRPDQAATALDDWRLMKLLIHSAKGKLTADEQMVALKWLELVSFGSISPSELPSVFSEEERSFLMEGHKDTDEVFRKRVQKLRRDAEIKIKGLMQSKDGHWLN